MVGRVGVRLERFGQVRCLGRLARVGVEARDEQDLGRAGGWGGIVVVATVLLLFSVITRRLTRLGTSTPSHNLQQILLNILHISHFVNAILLSHFLGGFDSSHDGGIVLGQLGNEQRRSAGIKLEASTHVGLTDPKQVVKVRLLPKERFVIGSIAGGADPSLEVDHLAGEVGIVAGELGTETVEQLFTIGRVEGQGDAVGLQAHRIEWTGVGGHGGGLFGVTLGDEVGDTASVIGVSSKQTQDVLK